MGQDYIFIKERILASGNSTTTYTTLTALLRSEGLGHLYLVFRRELLKNGFMRWEDIKIRKVKLNHLTYKKRKKL